MNANHQLQNEKENLENEITALKKQIEENKRIHGALLTALEQTTKKNDREDMDELEDTKRHFSATMEKMGATCKLLEQKIQKNKHFKNMVKCSSALQCKYCLKLIITNNFLQHTVSCKAHSTDAQYFIPSGFANKPQLRIRTEPDDANNHSLEYVPQDNQYRGVSSFSTDLQISVTQALLHEGLKIKSHNEYVIHMSQNGEKWTVTRNYQAICELFQSLATAFPNLKVPDLNFIDAGLVDSHAFCARSLHQFTEMKRLTLEKHLRDLAKIELIRNCHTFRHFLELDRPSQATLSNSIFEGYNHKNQGKIGFSFEKNSKFLDEEGFCPQNDLPSTYTNLFSPLNSKIIEQTANQLLDPLLGVTDDQHAYFRAVSPIERKTMSEEGNNNR